MTNTFKENLIDELTAFRRVLHQNAELSGKEKLTPKLVLDFLGSGKSGSVISGLGGNGMAIIYDSQEDGPTTVFRCELDGLPIHEVNTFAYRSLNQGVSHKCGHDGHMAIVSGLGRLLDSSPPRIGKIVLLYQPAEETGTGAEAVLNDERFRALKPDYIYALHNLPRLQKHKIFVKTGPFAASSRGIIVKLFGATSHAAEPEKGRSPAIALSEIIKEISVLPQINAFRDFTTITVVHALMGEIAFGVTPGYAEIRATLRTFLESDMDVLISAVTSIIENIAEREGLKHEISFTEIFPGTQNTSEAVEIVMNCAKKSSFEVEIIDQPFKWSEDFGHFLHHYKGALFGLGAGENTPSLHNNDYDFPDELISTGVELFFKIAKHHNF